MMILSIWYLHFSPQGPGLSQQIRRRLRGEKSRHICLIEYFSLNTFHWILFNLKSPCVGKIFLIEYFKAPIEYFSIPHQVDSHICKIQYFHSLSVPFNLSSLSIYLFKEISVDPQSSAEMISSRDVVSTSPGSRHTEWVNFKSWVTEVGYITASTSEP